MPTTENGLDYQRDWSNDPLWVHGTLEWDGEPLWFSAKVYDEPSRFGIDEGRTSKLVVTTVEDDWSPSYCPIDYDRGWGREPEGQYAELAAWLAAELETIAPLY